MAIFIKGATEEMIRRMFKDNLNDRAAEVFSDIDKLIQVIFPDYDIFMINLFSSTFYEDRIRHLQWVYKERFKISLKAILAEDQEEE